MTERTPSTQGEATATDRAGSLSRYTYPARTIGMLIGVSYIGLTYRDIHAPVWAWALLLFHALIGPHLSYHLGRAMRSRVSPLNFELGTQYVEALFVGTYVANVGFSLWPTTAAVAGTMVNNVLIGGTKQFIRCITITIASAATTFVLVGGRLTFQSSPAVSLLCACFVIFYVAMTSYLTRINETRLRKQKQEVERQRAVSEQARQEALVQRGEAQAAHEEADKLRHQALEDAEKLRELDQQKTAFFQNMSHELRTPLTLILSPLEQATRRHRDDEDLVVAEKNARRLLRLVNQLLDFQKLEAGKKKVVLEPFNINRFLVVLGDYFASACSSKEIEFRVTRDGKPIGRNQAVRIRGESDALEKVIFNFLSNALKYTPRGGVIELGLLVDTVSRQARVFVRDSGPGISEEGQKKLFQVFSQVDGSTTREYEGTGLGLALAKSLVEEMGGSVGVASEPGRGSTFFADFPMLAGSTTTDSIPVEGPPPNYQGKSWLLADTQETGLDVEGDEAPVSQELLMPEAHGRGETILVVDDLEDMRHMIASSLTRHGYRVLKAANGEQGYRVICARRPDLVITDWMMPKLSGPDMLKRVRANPAVAGTPVVLLTAKSDEESRVLGAEIGADVFLGKPFNELELVSTARNLLGLKAREKEVQKLNDYITESVLKRYLPPTLIGEIMSGNLSMDRPAELRDITVLFSDISGFTTLSETVGPTEIAAILNEYLTRMNQVIFDHGGTIDKFIGDAVMVLFGAPQSLAPAEQVRQAIECGMAMQAAMLELREKWKGTAAGAMRMRIGVHHGPAVVGNFGSQQRVDYTAIGPTVNLASRIESACKPGEVFCSEAVATLLPPDETQVAGTFTLKGIGRETTLFSVRAVEA